MLSNSYQVCKPWSYMEIIAKLSMREVQIMWMLMLNIKKMNHIIPYAVVFCISDKHQ